MPPAPPFSFPPRKVSGIFYTHTPMTPTITPLFSRPLTMHDLLAAFTLEESIKIAYIPIILTKSAFQYADFARRICVEKRLKFNKESRSIRQAFEDYNRHTLCLLAAETRDMLASQVDNFFDEADNYLQTLWYTIKNQLMKQFPDIGNYDLLSNIYMAVALLDYVHKFERAAGMEFHRRTGADYMSMVTTESVQVREALMSIAGLYQMDGTEMICSAIRAIALKTDKMVHVVRNQ